jgi:hypothetical protein
MQFCERKEMINAHRKCARHRPIRERGAGIPGTDCEGEPNARRTGACSLGPWENPGMRHGGSPVSVASPELREAAFR